jgi:hypothetical protein
LPALRGAGARRNGMRSFAWRHPFRARDGRRARGPSSVARAVRAVNRVYGCRIRP